MGSDTVRGGGRRWLGWGVVLAIVVVLAVASVWRPPLEAPPRPVGLQVDDPPLVKPSPPPTDYVGSAACAACHAEIAEKYARHPMGNSLNTVADAKTAEDYGHAEFAPPGPRRYSVERRDDGVYHHETMVDAQGEIYDQALPVKFTLGSGHRGHSYLIDHDGILFQSPIGWFTQGGKWDLSPGYRPQSHQRFERRVGDGCLYCHSGRVATKPNESDRYASPAFHEMAIGCERCHGPGQQHVKSQTAAKTTSGGDATIVNPAKLDSARRDSVCYQCHLQGESVIPRYGCGIFDFRPGQLLEDVFVVFVEGERVDARSQTQPVSQVEQMRASKCYIASEGRMGCIACHDPHMKPTASETQSHFRHRCLNCHADRGCALPPEKQDAAPAAGSCIHCHMPRLHLQDVAHTALTDHRVLRRSDTAGRVRRPTKPEDLVPFDGAEDRLPRREVDRARGIAIAGVATGRSDKILAHRAEHYLVPPQFADTNLLRIFEAIGDDLLVLDSLGAVYLLTDRKPAAQACWLRVLELDPRNETALDHLLTMSHDQREFADTKHYIDRLLAINPNIASLYGRRADVCGQLGEWDEGIQSARRGLELDPTMIQLREWLIHAYRRAGQKTEGDEQAALLERLKAALQIP